MKSKEQKRKEAIERNELHSSLSLNEKLDKLERRPGDSLKERNKLLDKLN